MESYRIHSSERSPGRGRLGGRDRSKGRVGDTGFHVQGAVDK